MGVRIRFCGPDPTEAHLELAAAFVNVNAARPYSRVVALLSHGCESVHAVDSTLCEGRCLRLQQGYKSRSSRHERNGHGHQLQLLAI